MLEIISLSLPTISGLTFFSILLDAYYERKILLGTKYLLISALLGFITISLLLKFGIYFVLFIPIIVFLIVLFSCLKNKE